MKGATVTVSATGNCQGTGVVSYYDMTVYGTLIAYGNHRGIIVLGEGNGQKGNLVVKETGSVIASSSEGAITAYRLNYVEGTGWSDEAGTTGERRLEIWTNTDSTVSTPYRNLQGQYKKVIFLAEATVSKAPTANAQTYTGYAQELVTAGTADCGTMYYALSDNAVSAPEFDGTSEALNKKWGISVPKGTNAGTYYVWYMVKGDSYHKDSKPECVTVTINKAAATVKKAPTAKTLTYTGSKQNLVDAGTADGGTTYYALGTETGATEPYTISIPAKTDAGTYYVWYMVKGDRIHSDTAATCIPVSIAPKETFTVTFDPGDGTGSMDPVQVTDGAPFTFPTNIFTAPSGYVFAHWIINDRHYAVGEQITVNSDLTVTAVWAPVDENNTRTVTNTLTSVPASLSNLYSTVSELENALLYRLSVKGNIATRDNTEIFDVILQVLINGKWVEATPYNFPPGKLRVTFPYPSGIDKNLYDFYVCHMFTVDMHGHERGGTETPDVIKTEKGIQVDLDGLSPVAISWNKINTKALESLPQTGDNSLHPAVYGLIAALSILIIVFLIRRKR